ADEEILGEDLQARLDEELLHERVAHLDRWALARAAFGELIGGHGGAVDAVAASLGADVDHRVSNAARPAVKDAIGADDAAGEGVDEDVAVIGLVEEELAADRRDTDAVAIASDARDDAAEQGRRAGVIRAAEAEGVHVGDGA